MSKIYFDKNNNFDLIRLFAALQVVYCHAISHFRIPNNFFSDFISYFPGVPIFFTISGFLIANSFTRNPNVKSYLRNRSLRIFPALWVCLLITIILLIAFGIINSQNVFSLSFLSWILGQVTLFQFYTPDLLRAWGVGAPNGSLWTITVEYQFYILLPLILWLFNLSNRKIALTSVLILFLISILVSYISKGFDPESLYTKLLGVSVLPYLHFFLVGIFAYLFWNRIGKYFNNNNALLWTLTYFTYSFIFSNTLKLFALDYSSNFFPWVSDFLLAGLILSIAFTKGGIAHKLLNGTDISYGVYIYHMVVINTIISLNIQEYQLPIAFTATIIIAFISWKLVEKPALKLKT